MRRIGWLGVVLLGLALAAPAPAAGQSLPKWRMGVVQYKADTAFELAGFEKGFYKEQGLDFEPVEMPGDADILRALAAGTFEMAEITPAGTMAAIEKGAGLKIVASFMPGLPHVFYARKDIAGFADLAGKPVAVSGFGALPHVIAQVVLENHKVDLKKVEWIQMGGDPDRVRALVTGQAAGTVASIEHELIVKPAGGKVLAVASREVPLWTRFTLITTERVIKERPGDLVKALVAHAKGIRHAINPRNKDEMVRLMAKYGKRDPKQVEWIYDWFMANKQFNSNGDVNPASLTWMQELNVKLGRQKAVLPLERVATDEFQRQAIAQVGEAR
jgi:NitT/TauT family transport system substrate-binding protein